jgi:chemotaxis-related protein WspD
MQDLPANNAVGAAVAIDDCWNKIGIRGDASCPKLETYAHCRNCPVHAAAAVTLLDRDPPPGYVADWTGHFAQAKRTEEVDTDSAVVFRIGAEWFALSTQIFDEIAEPRAIHSLPHRRSSTVLGLVNVRGQLIICVALGKMLGVGEEPGPRPERDGLVHGRMAVIRHDGGRLAFLVDEVDRIQRFHPRDLRAVPATIAKSAAAYTRGVLSSRDRIVGCLDGQLIFQAVNRSIA